jgi:2-keto-3-deoxy-6-phosphogluconate aldolase
VIEECQRHDTADAWVLHADEILAAWDLGVDIVKVFPATALGPGFIKDVRGPLPKVKLMPTGGVTKQNAGEWIRAGAVAMASAPRSSIQGRRGRRFERSPRTPRHLWTRCNMLAASPR